jgi:hypothetical protein
VALEAWLVSEALGKVRGRAALFLRSALHTDADTLREHKR